MAAPPPPTPNYQAAPLPAAAASISSFDGSNSADFPIPAAKRPRLSPQPAPFPQAQAAQSQHVSPYANPSPSQSAPPTPGTLYNGTVATPRYNHTPSPHFSNAPASQATYTTPYSNGSTTAPTSIMNTNTQFSPLNSRPNFTSSPYATTTNYGVTNSQGHHTQNQFASQHNQYNQNFRNNSTNAAGNMGPPMKPTNEHDPNHTDILTGTGIDLREEEAYSQSQFTFSQNATGTQSMALSNKIYSPYVAGPAEALYGSGLASQPAEHPGEISQEEWERKVAEEAWHVAAERMALSRQAELANPFSLPKIMQEKMRKTVQHSGLRMNFSRAGDMGPLKTYMYKDLQASAATRASNGQAMIVTNGTALPQSALVVDQLILLSLATKQRTEQLLEEVVRLARGRQTGSSGFVSPEWIDSAVPANAADGTIVSTEPEAPRIGWESAVSPRTNPLKRKRLPTPVSDGTKTPISSTKSFANELAKSLRDTAKIERDFEEERLKKRNARKDGPLRSGSVAPGTPGSVASPSGTPTVKGPTRKELEKKNKEKKKEDAASNMSANATSNMFLGSIGKKKKYNWMNAPSTNIAAQYSIKGPSGLRVATPVVPEPPAELTQRGQMTLGNWREDKSSGAKVQMRDWVTVLEEDGGSAKELQRALMWLDGNTKPRKDVSDN